MTEGRPRETFAVAVKEAKSETGSFEAGDIPDNSLGTAWTFLGGLGKITYIFRAAL